MNASEHRRVHACHTSTCDVDVEALEVRQLVQLQVRVAVRGMRTVVFQPVQVLVAFSANFAPVGLLLLHANGSGVWDRSQRIDNGESTVFILFELLILVAVLFHVSIKCLIVDVT